jgi:hypothetical protein
MVHLAHIQPPVVGSRRFSIHTNRHPLSISWQLQQRSAKGLDPLIYSGGADGLQHCRMGKYDWEIQEKKYLGVGSRRSIVVALLPLMLLGVPGIGGWVAVARMLREYGDGVNIFWESTNLGFREGKERANCCSCYSPLVVGFELTFSLIQTGFPHLAKAFPPCSATILRFLPRLMLAA